MTRNFANRIGHSINHGTGGGVFNSLSQYILNKNNKWTGDGSIDFPSTVSPTTYTPGDGYTYVVMDSSALFSVFDGAVTIDYMIVAGGGCNGSQPESDAVGGGGAGGFRSGTATVGPGIYRCTVGSGSPAGTGVDKPNGSPSSVESPNGFEITSAGGGRGGSARYPASSNYYEDLVLQVEPTSGGSGGGGGSGPSVTFYGPMIAGSPGNVPAVTPPQGNAGGDGTGPAKGSGGGGGAGGAGGDANGGAGGAGGVGRAYPFSYTAIPTDWGTPGPTASEPPTARWFAGGGGGASDFPPGPHPASLTVGGAGGGGQGDIYDPSLPIPQNMLSANGQVNTGGGGGGSRYQISTGGGSGIIIIRYST